MRRIPIFFSENDVRKRRPTHIHNFMVAQYDIIQFWFKSGDVNQLLQIPVNYVIRQH